ncbi:hypothetical protein D3C77_808660 [compost metagenome]
MIPDLRLIQPDNLFQHTAHPVADDGVANFFAGRHTEPKSLDFRLIRPIDDKLAVSERFSEPVYPAEIRPVP